MILYRYKCLECHRTFEEVREIEDRKWAGCPHCVGIGFKLLSAATADVNFRPGVYKNLAPVPVQINSREDFTKVSNLMGNYANIPFAKREVKEIKQPTKRDKARLIQKLRRGIYE
jgi:putative FmdB family regulatory protein